MLVWIFKNCFLYLLIVCFDPGKQMERNESLPDTTRNKYVAAALGSIFNHVAKFLQLSAPGGFFTLGILQLTCRDMRKLILHSGRIWASRSCPTTDRARNMGFIKSFGTHISVLDVSNVKTVDEICTLVSACPNLTCLLSRKSLDNKMRRSVAAYPSSPMCRAQSKDVIKSATESPSNATTEPPSNLDSLLDILETRAMRHILLANTTFTHDKLYKFLLKVGLGLVSEGLRVKG